MQPLPTFEEMIAALQAEDLLPTDIRLAQGWYKREVTLKLQEVRNGEFATAVLAHFAAWQKTYSSRFQLLTSPTLDELPFVSKPFESVVNKIYRGKFLSANPSNYGLVECFARMDDLVRITLSSPYGDGPRFLADQLSILAQQLNVNHNAKERADDFGYYAIHFTFETPVDVLDPATSQINSAILTAEIQLTTQLQLSLRTLTHKLYEKRRLMPQPSSDWKWDFGNELFRPSYTGHTLHLLESLLLEMKEREESAHGK